jgi:hypothetical protein
VLLANNRAVFERPPLQGAGHSPLIKDKVAMWTDDYSNLFRILK